MFPNDFFIFLQIILFLFITPGPPRVVIVSHTLNYGVKKSVWTAFGDISANLCQGILVVFFIGTFLSDNSNILQAFRLGEKTWGVQFHPEFSKKIIREYIHQRAVAIREEGLDPTKLCDQASNTPNSIILFQKFCRLAMTMRHC